MQLLIVALHFSAFDNALNYYKKYFVMFKHYSSPIRNIQFFCLKVYFFYKSKPNIKILGLVDLYASLIIREPDCHQSRWGTAFVALML
jgi:hypothetical protein